MNNRGQVIFFTFMVGIVIILLAIAFAPGIKKQIDTARDSNNLDCSNSSISNFDKATCVVADLTIFHYVIGVVVLAGAVIAARRFLT